MMFGKAIATSFLAKDDSATSGFFGDG